MLLTAVLLLCRFTTLDVGDGMPFSRIEDAVAAAKPGDTISVHPCALGYPRTAVLIDKSNLHIGSAMLPAIKLDGEGFDYSGQGQTPRAIFQIGPNAKDVTIQDFELVNAHNGSFNGAGVRIDGGRNVRIYRCMIHGNDMGVMSNGRQGDTHSGEHQVISTCEIYGNGNLGEAGYNHNLYLGGASVRVEECIIHDALTGHNLKSRAHFTRVQDSHLYGGDNRQIDLVDSWDTARPDSNAVIYNSVIEENPAAKGNRNVIHFGQESGHRVGNLYLINDTIRTSSSSPVVLLDSPDASVEMDNCLVVNPEEANPVLAAFGKGAVPAALTGHANVIGYGYRFETLESTIALTREQSRHLPAKFPGWRLYEATWPDENGAHEYVGRQDLGAADRYSKPG